MIRGFIRKVYIYWLHRRFPHFGGDSYIHPLGIYGNPKCIHIGDHVYIGPRAIISASEGVFFGNGVTIGPEFIVMGGDHNFQVVGKLIWQTHSGGINKKVVIESDVWVGARVTVLKGITIGEGAIIGAGSVVTKSILPYMIYAGNPALIIKPRFKPEELRQHLDLVKSSYDYNVLVGQLYQS